MTAIGRAARTVLALGVVVSCLGGCEVTFWDNASSDEDCESRTLDLREPVTRADVGLDDGESSTSWSCDDGFEVRLELPDGPVEIETRRLGADSRQSDDPTSGAPTTIDLQSTWLEVDEAGDLADRVADAFGMSHDQIDAWRRAAQDPPDDTVDTKTRFIHGGAGEVRADLQVIHQSVSGNNTVHLILYVNR